MSGLPESDPEANGKCGGLPAGEDLILTAANIIRAQTARASSANNLPTRGQAGGFQTHHQTKAADQSFIRHFSSEPGLESD